MTRGQTQWQPFSSHDTSNFHPFFSWFYKRGEKAYAVSLENPYDSMVELEKLPADECRPERVFRPAHLDYYGMLKEIVEKPHLSILMLWLPVVKYLASEEETASSLKACCNYRLMPYME